MEKAKDNSDTTKTTDAQKSTDETRNKQLQELEERKRILNEMHNNSKKIKEETDRLAKEIMDKKKDETSKSNETNEKKE